MMRIQLPGAFLILAFLPFLHGCGASDGSVGSESGGWEAGPGLRTRWSAQVDPLDPLPEYPRPQLVRPEWTNLNGLWELAVGPDSDAPPPQFPERILVPFPVESALSGVTQPVSPQDRVWYRRTFTASVSDPTRWILHFGAVDWEAEVWIDGELLGSHRGGYDSFSFDITDALTDALEHELVVGVRDPSSEGDQPRGKQVLDPHGIWYTSVTGIWQTVWLEPVAEIHVSALRIVPNLSEGSVTVSAEVEGAFEPVGVDVTVLDAGREVGVGHGLSGEDVSIAVPNPHLWSPDDPFLYDLKVSVGNGPTQGGDEVSSYFGMRSIGIGPDSSGHQRLLLNGSPLFQYGLLDQGWWPDGLYTAPTDEALRFDIIQSKELGFNLIRKHVKVEPARWYYHADREGILVWQDMPSGDNESSDSHRQFANELMALVESLGNHPSIVMWVPFNEGWGQHDTEPVTGWIKAFDPSRLVNGASGWTDEGGGDVLDIHRYPGPGVPDPKDLLRFAPPPRQYPEGLPTFPEVRVAVLGEFGGLGLPIPGHTWVDEDNWGYRSYEDLDALNGAYQDLLLQLRPLIGEGLAAAVYTQTTDVEVEVNGMMTYDREVVKLDARSAEAASVLLDPPPVIREVVSTSIESAQLWRITEDAPVGGWIHPQFDDSAWTQAPGGFGTDRTPGARVGTVWESPDLWLRRSFELGVTELEALRSSALHLRIHHDEDAEVYLNGVQISVLEGYTSGYRIERLNNEAVGLLQEGRNTLAVHVSQTDGGQFIDVGIVEWLERLE